MRRDYEADVREVEREHAFFREREASAPLLVAVRDRVKEALQVYRPYLIEKELEALLSSIESRIAYGKDATEEGAADLDKRLAKILAGRAK